VLFPFVPGSGELTLLIAISFRRFPLGTHGVALAAVECCNLCVCGRVWRHLAPAHGVGHWPQHTRLGP
jgi:hypothetical protein